MTRREHSYSCGCALVHAPSYWVWQSPSWPAPIVGEPSCWMLWCGWTTDEQKCRSCWGGHSAPTQSVRRGLRPAWALSPCVVASCFFVCDSIAAGTQGWVCARSGRLGAGGGPASALIAGARASADGHPTSISCAPMMNAAHVILLRACGGSGSC